MRQLSGLNLEEGTDGEWRLTWNGSIQWQFARKDDVVKLYVMEDGGEEFDVEPIETGECRRGMGSVCSDCLKDVKIFLICTFWSARVRMGSVQAAGIFY